MATSSCPAAHLMVFSRSLALDCGVYKDTYAQGSHDWDTTLRMADAGVSPVRVQHILYGWRMHANSSAVNVDAKDYLKSSLVEVIRNSLQRRNLGCKYAVEDGLYFGYFHLTRLPKESRPFAVDFVMQDINSQSMEVLEHNILSLHYPKVEARIVVVSSDTEQQVERVLLKIASIAKAHNRSSINVIAAYPGAVAETVSSCSTTAFAKVIVDGNLLLTNPDFLWELLGSFELDETNGVFGGLIVDEQEQVQHLGYVSGLTEFDFTPHYERLLSSVVPQLTLRRNVMAVCGGLIAVRKNAFEQVGPLTGVDSDDGIYGLEFSLRARAHDINVGYTPKFSARRKRPLNRKIIFDKPIYSSFEGQKFVWGDVDPYYTPLMSQYATSFGTYLQPEIV